MKANFKNTEKSWVIGVPLNAVAPIIETEEVGVVDTLIDGVGEI